MKKDLAQLFKWSDKVEIRDVNGNIRETLYIRLVGDIDYGQAQQYGLLASRKMRKKLNDVNSVDYQALFLDLDERDKNELVLGILLAELSNFRASAMEELGDDFMEVPELSDAPTLEEREQQQEAEEKLSEQKVKALQTKMEEKSNERKAELEKLPRKDLIKEFKDASINFKCLDEFSKVFREYCVYAGTFVDSKFSKKAFDDFDEFRNSSTEVKRQLADSYIKLELTGDQLKN